MSRSVIATRDRGAVTLVQVLVAVAALAIALVGMMPTSGPASAAPGNNGTIKIKDLGGLDGGESNVPHVGCGLTVEWWDFDPGHTESTVTFESKAPTLGTLTGVTGPSTVGFESAGGAGLDTTADYTLAFTGDPQPQQGYHVKLTVESTYSNGNDTKSKVFWVTGCEPPTPTTDLSLTKTASRSTAAPGDRVTYTLTATNTGQATAVDVVVTDKLPAGTSYSSSSASCTRSGSTVTCRLGDIAPGAHASATITVKVSRHQTSVASHDHQLGATKVESHLSVLESDIGTTTTWCPAGYVATDGSVRLDHVDQDTGTFADVMVLQSEATDDGRGWTGTVLNDTTGQLQAKVNVVCLSDRTVSGENHSHPIAVSAPVTTTISGDADRSYEVDLVCTDPTAIAITPGFSFTGGNGIVNSRPLADQGGRHVRVAFEDAGDVTLTIRCLGTQLGSASGHTHQLVVTDLSDSVVVPAGGIVERSLTCPVGAKGIVAWTDFDGASLGNDPQPITRVFRFYNPTGGPLTARYGLTCIDVRTAGGNHGSWRIVNTATVAPTDATPADNSASATITVQRNRVGTGGRSRLH